MPMLSISDSCLVCAEEWGPLRPLHSIPCGHILCERCCSHIIDTTPSRLSPLCPFCREPFTRDGIRLIRMDFSTSGWSTPRTAEAHGMAHLHDEAWKQKADKVLSSDRKSSRGRSDARRLEDRVAKIASKKCSVEEVSRLHKELQDFLIKDPNPDDESISLFLSAALLRAILMNHLAHAESSKAQRATEAALRAELAKSRAALADLEDELRSHFRSLCIDDILTCRRSHALSLKAHECQTLQSELSRFRLLNSTLSPMSSLPFAEPESRIQSPTSSAASSRVHSPHASPPTSPTPYSQASMSRASHLRSASMQVSSLSSSRPTTPARTSTTSASSTYRSRTPAPPSRTGASTPTLSRIPAPAVPSLPQNMPPRYALTPAPIPSAPMSSASSASRSKTPGPASGSRSRRLSQPQPMALMMRSASSGERDQHERWIPSMPDSPTPTASSVSSGSANGARNLFNKFNLGRSTSSASAAAARGRDGRSTVQP
ncbi:hypothetical protein FISHEDRAFT_77518 [Fistulina hepatica ATCC 64428]|uniref:RING-type domain-containing protein n=1 Tax=Fistulina hepatica ATCC 64428 TaxID=1128425 RepID=A0A0D7A0R7_9AGAR|nr:hypothetical protein FISHEDRAFT_77518 [Fistulina hepatica ATCC 64428]